MKKLLASCLALCLTLSLGVLPASALEAEDAKDLLQSYYVDEISQEILELDSLDAILEALNDPYTGYLTAEAYEKFLSTVNGSEVVGIGVSIQNAFDNGHRIMSVLPKSPALEAGLEAGDRIIAVGGVTLTADMEIQSMIGGPAGTEVTITVVRQSGRQEDYTLTRRAVAIPIITFQKDGTIGLIDCVSFGESTGPTVREALETLDDQVTIWVMDLRENPGGTDRAAASAAGFFAGGAIMVYFRGGDGAYHYTGIRPECPDLTDKPLVILTSPYSASGSELFAAAARDLGFGIALGQRTFGKGVAQLVLDERNFPSLFEGDALKITAYRFFSPNGTTNDVSGILPTLLVTPEHTRIIAQLLSAEQPKSPENHLKLELAGHTFYLSLEQGMKKGNISAFTELLEALPPAATLYTAGEKGEWTATFPAFVAAQLGLEFTPRTFSDLEDSPFREEIATLASYRMLGGYEDGTFRPGQTITRAEFCAMVAGALALPASGKLLPFDDVKDSDWYANAVSAMVARGFLSGDAASFRPDSAITYEEMVTILASVAAWAHIDSYENAKEPYTVGQWGTYQDYSVWAQIPARTLDQVGALVGDLAPRDTGTREVAAGMLCTLMKNIHMLWN